MSIERKQHIDKCVREMDAMSNGMNAEALPLAFRQTCEYRYMDAVATLEGNGVTDAEILLARLSRKGLIRGY